eukprot:4481665-Pleurochrysis_carterae.AAC.1
MLRGYEPDNQRDEVKARSRPGHIPDVSEMSDETMADLFTRMMQAQAPEDMQTLMEQIKRASQG